MKMGTENRNKVIAAAAALIMFAVVLMAARFSGLVSLRAAVRRQPTVVAADIPPDRQAQPSAGGNPRGGTAERPTQSLDFPLSSDLLWSSEDMKSEGAEKKISAVSVEPPKAPAVPARPVAPRPQPASVPAPPPLPLKYFGYGVPLGGAQRIFLMNGDDLFIAKEGDIVEGRYKVVRISPSAVEILDVLSNQQQSLPLTQG